MRSSEVSVAVCVNTRYAPARLRVLGMADHGREQGWNLTLFNVGGAAAVPLLDHWRGDGALCFGAEETLRRHLRSRRLPFVEANYSNDRASWFVGADEKAIAKMAGAHLMRDGRRSVGFCGYAGSAASALRGEAMLTEMERCVPGAAKATFELRSAESFEEVERLARWVRGLPRPLALAAHDDQSAFAALQGCRLAGLAVPEEVAVLGVGDDTMMTEMASPPLSSVMLPARHIGRLAAEMLGRLLAGEKPERRGVLVAPSGIQERRSTQLDWSADTLVRGALRKIRESGGQLDARTLAEQCGVSRRTLERRIGEKVGQGAGELLLQARMDEAGRMLRTTTKKIEEIAALVGYASASSFSRAFGARFGRTPGEYRIASRGDQ